MTSINARDLAKQIRENNLSKNHFDDNDIMLLQVRQLIKGILFTRNEKCENDFVLTIPEENRPHYETKDSFGLSSANLPEIKSISEFDGIIFVTIGEQEMELEDMECQGLNFVTLFDSLINSFGNWAVMF